MNKKQVQVMIDKIRESINSKITKRLKPFNAVIQICPKCNKIDVYKNDNHECIRREEWLDE
jgi:hypothetical protein